MAEQHVDVLIIGAGVSGISAACHLRRECPGKSYAVLERRERIGGTWDLFRYPGVRSDSDMFTFGYAFRPWNETRVLADGPAIRRYVEQTAAEYGVAEHIRFGRRVRAARWSSAGSSWTVEAEDVATGELERYTAGYVVSATGYYDHDQGYRPELPGEERFRGRLVHPQHWPDDLDHRGRRVIVIGSGATAVTLVPALADDGAAHVTMLQRSPTYILSMPALDTISEGLRRILPDAFVYRLARQRNITIQRLLYRLARSRPGFVRGVIRKSAERHLAGSADLADFTPRYDPWDQRLCIVPDGDLFRVIREGRADVVTDQIETITEGGVRLASGKELEADVIVTATGLQVQMFGGAAIEVDGEPIAINQAVTYKGVLLEGVPNLSAIFGYANASWTLKADIASAYTCRLLNYLDRHGFTRVVARATDADRADGSVLGSLTSGYVRRGNDRLPRQGTQGPWRVHNDYRHDAPMLTRESIADGILQFGRGPAAPRTDDAPEAAAVAT